MQSKSKAMTEKHHNDHPEASNNEAVVQYIAHSVFAPSTMEAILQGRRAATPAEFAKMFGHHPTWGYRQLYAGRVKVIRDAGRVLIPLKEIERFEADTVTYGELKNTRSSKASRKND